MATNYNTVYDQLTDETGVIVDMNGKAIADGIYSLAINSDKRQFISDNAQKENHDNITMISQYYELIEE